VNIETDSRTHEPALIQIQALLPLESESLVMLFEAQFLPTINSEEFGLLHALFTNMFRSTNTLNLWDESNSDLIEFVKFDLFSLDPTQIPRRHFNFSDRRRPER